MVVLLRSLLQHAQAHGALANHESLQHRDFLCLGDGTDIQDRQEETPSNNHISDTDYDLQGSEAANQMSIPKESLNNMGDTSNAVPMNPSNFQNPNGC